MMSNRFGSMFAYLWGLVTSHPPRGYWDKPINWPVCRCRRVIRPPLWGKHPVELYRG